MNNSENSENSNQGLDDTQQNVIKPLTEQESEEAFARQKAEANHDIAQEIAEDDAKHEERSWDRDPEGSELKPDESTPTDDLSFFGDSKPDKKPRKLSRRTLFKNNPARAYRAEPFNKEERERNLALARKRQSEQDKTARLVREKNRLAREAAAAAHARWRERRKASKAAALKKKTRKPTYGPKYRPSMSLREAWLVARFGKIGAHPLTQAALEFWAIEPALATSERPMTELVQGIDDLRQQQASVQRLFKFNAGFGPQFIHDRERLRQSVNELLEVHHDRLADAVKWHQEVRWLHFQAEFRFKAAYKKADRETRRGLASLRTQWEAGEVKDLLAMRLIETHARFATEFYRWRALRQEVVFENDLASYTVRRGRAPLYYVSWAVGFKRLDDPLLRTLKPSTGYLMRVFGDAKDSKIEEKYLIRAKALGWELSPELEPEPEPAVLYCECGAELEPRKRKCDNCRQSSEWANHLVIETPIDITWMIGKPQEASWQHEDRLDWEAYYALKGEQPELQSPTTQTDEYGEYRKAFLGSIDQRTRDIDDIRGAHRILGYIPEGVGPMHTNLSNLGKGFDEPDR